MRYPAFKPFSWKLWSVLAMTLLTVCLGFWLDKIMKKTELWGVAPIDTQLQVLFDDFPGAWANWQNTRTAKSMTEHIPRQLHQLALFFRLNTGIRPTPLRVSLWLGQRTVLGVRSSGDAGLQWGVSIHPGLLLRGGHMVKRFFGIEPSEDIFRHKDWYYAWRDGFLVASESKNYVKDAIASKQFVVPSAKTNAEVLFQWTGAHAGHAALSLNETLTFDTEFIGNLPPLPDAAKSEMLLKDDPNILFSVISGNPKPILEYLGMENQFLHHDLLAPFIAHIAPWWKAWVLTEALSELELDSMYFSLNGVDLSQGLPIPLWVLSLHTTEYQTQHPFLSIINSSTPLPYFWNDKKGHLMPLAGLMWTLALEGENHVWNCASQEVEMQRLLSVDTPLSLNWQGDLRILLHWPQLGNSVATLASYAAKYEFLFWNEQELQEKLVPYLDFLNACGEFNFTASANKGVVHGFGHLNRIGALP